MISSFESVQHVLDAADCEKHRVTDSSPIDFNSGVGRLLDEAQSETTGCSLACLEVLRTKCAWVSRSGKHLPADVLGLRRHSTRHICAAAHRCNEVRRLFFLCIQRLI
jgi:hypothetical protein